MSAGFNIYNLLDEVSNQKSSAGNTRTYTFSGQGKRPAPQELSPAEKARQILQSIELSEKKNSLSTLEEQGEGLSMEGSELPAVAYDSPIYEGDLTKELVPIQFDQTSVIQGLIFSEILGKPRSRRMGRW